MAMIPPVGSIDPGPPDHPGEIASHTAHAYTPRHAQLRIISLVLTQESAAYDQSPDFSDLCHRHFACA